VGSKHLAAVVLWAALVVIVPSEHAWASASGWAATQLTTDPKGVAALTASESRVVWTDGDGRRILTWRAGDSAPTTIAAEDLPHYSLGVSGDRVVWMYSPSGANEEIFTWKAGDAAPTQISAGGGRPKNPQVSGDRVVWTGYEDYPLFTWKAGDSAPTQLTTGTAWIYPSVSGDRIAWSDGGQVFFFRVGDTAPRQLTSWLNFAGSAPRISGDRLVWSASFGPGYPHIYTWKDGDATPTQLTDANHSYAYWGVSGDRLAWTGYGNVFTWKVGDASPTQLNTGNNSGALVLSGDRLAWAAWTGANYEIFTWKAGDSAPTQVTSGSSQLTGGPVLSGDRILWTRNVDGVSQLFAAVFRAVPVAATDSYSTPEDTALTVAALGVLSNDTAGGGDALTASLVSGVSHGTLAPNANGSFTYTPTAGYSGSDSFTYCAYDGTAYSNTVTVSITVTPGMRTLTYTAGSGGTISGTSPQTVNYDGSGTAVTAVPNIGYHFVSWSDGVTTPSRTELVVLDNLTITAIFAANPLPKATVYTPVAPSTMYRGHSYPIYGYVAPRHTSGTYLVTLKFYKRNSSGTYVYHHSVNARRYYYSTAKTKYKASVSLPHTGKWRVRAYHSCSKHTGSYSGYDYITVK
jgi:hypothetical protein